MTETSSKENRGFRVEFVRESGNNPVKNLTVTTLVERGFTATFSYCYVGFQIEEWRDFCSAVYHAMAIVSCSFDGFWVTEPLHVRVTLADGRVLRTHLVFDPLSGGIRYVSLHE